VAHPGALISAFDDFEAMRAKDLINEPPDKVVPHIGAALGEHTSGAALGEHKW
jgi:hypothetical protein